MGLPVSLLTPTQSVPLLDVPLAAVFLDLLTVMVPMEMDARLTSRVLITVGLAIPLAHHLMLSAPAVLVPVLLLLAIQDLLMLTVLYPMDVKFLSTLPPTVRLLETAVTLLMASAPV